MHYTVCFLFDGAGRVLLQKKDRTDFAGRLNGVGGKFQPGESPGDCALREIREETGCIPDNLTWLGDLTPPDNCDGAHRDEACHLHFFAGMAKAQDISQQPGETEALEWHSLGEILGSPLDPRLAGDGDVWYFIQKGARILGCI